MIRTKVIIPIAPTAIKQHIFFLALVFHAKPRAKNRNPEENRKEKKWKQKLFHADRENERRN